MDVISQSSRGMSVYKSQNIPRAFSKKNKKKFPRVTGRIVVDKKTLVGDKRKF